MSIEAVEKIKTRFPEAVEETHSHAGDDTVRVQRDSWFTVLEFVRKTLALIFSWISLQWITLQGRGLAQV